LDRLPSLNGQRNSSLLRHATFCLAGMRPARHRSPAFSHAWNIRPSSPRMIIRNAHFSIEQMEVVQSPNKRSLHHPDACVQRRLRHTSVQFHRRQRLSAINIVIGESSKETLLDSKMPRRVLKPARRSTTLLVTSLHRPRQPRSPS